MGFDDAALRALVRCRPASPGDVVVDELSLGMTGVRADVAVLGRTGWHGVEIKGEGDTFARLGRQAVAYGQVFDTCELVTVPRMIDKAVLFLPSWWSISVPTQDGEALEPVRDGATSDVLCAQVRAQLLWRQEVWDELKAREAAAGLSRATRWVLWDRLAQLVGVHELGEVVRRRMLARPAWLADEGRERAGTQAARLARQQAQEREMARQAASRERMRRWQERFGDLPEQ